MGQCRRSWIIGHDLDNHVITFPDDKQWQLTKKICGKPWDGSPLSERAEHQDWCPDEEHAVYECTQVRGPDIGSEAIMKVRVEVPHASEDYSDKPEERAKEASGMRLNHATTQEIENLQELTTAGCSVTPHLLGVKIDIQDTLVPASQTYGYYERQEPHWWIPGGYIVYILMAKLPAQPLGINIFWDENLFTRQDRDEIRKAFRESWLELRKLGWFHCDEKLENLMWDKVNRKCYIIDLEMMGYGDTPPDPFGWDDGEYFGWNLARRWGKHSW